MIFLVIRKTGKKCMLSQTFCARRSTTRTWYLSWIKSFATNKQVFVIIIYTFSVKKINKSPYHLILNTIFTELPNFAKINKTRKKPSSDRINSYNIENACLLIKNLEKYLFFIHFLWKFVPAQTTDYGIVNYGMVCYGKLWDGITRTDSFYK